MSADLRGTRLWLVPHDLRPRYAAEWRADLAGAASVGLSAEQLLPGMRATAWQLRRRLILDTLVGRRGTSRALAWWVALLLVSLVLVSPVLLTPLIVVGLVAGIVTANRGRGVLVGLALLWAGLIVYSFAAFSVGFDYADANRPQPAWTRAWLVAWASSVVVLTASLVANVRFHDPRPARAEEGT